MARVLVVDDDEDIAALVVEILRAEGYEADAVNQGDAAFPRAVDTLPHVVMLDLMMPGMDGFAVARTLRGDERTRHIPIIVMSALHAVEERAAEIGCQHVLPKPFDYHALTTCVARVVQPPIDMEQTRV